MKKKEQSSSRVFEERKQQFMLLFSREARMVRDSIVEDLPAYNLLLSIHAESFEEITLRQLAEQQNIIYDPERPPIPDCPFCGQSDSVGRKEDNILRCRRCDKTFTINHNSIASGTKCDALTWMKILQCLLNYTGVSKTCEYCEISENTYYNIRNRLFYAMQIVLQGIKLYGNIEVDNTFVRSSYKGVNLCESEFPEDSIFFDDSFKPRSARARGGSFSNDIKNANHICIFTGIDDRGHVIARFAGVGNISYLSLKHYIPADKFLTKVPAEDPFALLRKKKPDDAATKPQQASVMIADKEGAIKRFAQLLDIEFESHVYRKNGVQLKLSGDAHNIQCVNALHRRLKDFLRKHGYISSKYLPGFLTLFEFVENTGASEAAIAELFRVIACPNLGKPPAFFKEMFTVPNYLEQWLHDEHPLNKFPYNKLLAFYLYDMTKHPDKYPDAGVTMAQIEEETEYTAPTVRKLYRELYNAGYRDLILRHFEVLQSKKRSETKVVAKPTAPSTLNPVVLAIYDAYAEIRKLPKSKRPTFDEFLEEKNKEFGTNFKRANLLAKFKYIEERGVREPLEPLQLLKQEERVRTPSDRALEIYQAYEEIRLSYREKGEEPPQNLQIYSVLSARFGFTISVIERHVVTTRAHLRRLKANETHENK